VPGLPSQTADLRTVPLNFRSLRQIEATILLRLLSVDLGGGVAFLDSVSRWSRQEAFMFIGLRFAQTANDGLLTCISGRRRTQTGRQRHFESIGWWIGVIDGPRPCREILGTDLSRPPSTRSAHCGILLTSASHGCG